MRLLITNQFLEARTGSEVYSADLAAGLRARGHNIALYSPQLGHLADLLRADGFFVTADLTELPWIPEIIHAQHYQPTTLAALAFPNIPIFSLCHGATPAEEQSCLAPNVVARAAVDEACRQRVMRETGATSEDIEIIPNGVRLDLFPERTIFPTKIQRALVFSNYEKDGPILQCLRAACDAEGLTLDVAGSSNQTSMDKPWEVLPQYDLVFARGRCALEAMACGCSVILHGDPGLGAAVRASDFTGLRHWNFGFTLLQAPHRVNIIRRRIHQCSVENSRAVMDVCRATASQEDVLTALERRYEEILKSGTRSKSEDLLQFASQFIPAVPPGWQYPPDNTPPPPLPDNAKTECLLDAYLRLSNIFRDPHGMEKSEGLSLADLVSTTAASIEVHAGLFSDQQRTAIEVCHGYPIPPPALPPPIPFVVGCPRSGTTWLRLTLDAHPDLAMPPETGFIDVFRRFGIGQPCSPGDFLHVLLNYPPAHPHFLDYNLNEARLWQELQKVKPFTITGGLRVFYRLYAEKFGKKICGDKTPFYSNLQSDIERLLPEARFIHLIRDGRGAINSLRRQCFRSSENMGTLAAFWASSVQKARADGLERRHYLEVRYEDVVARREETLRGICAFLDLPWAPEMMQHHLGAPKRLDELQDSGIPGTSTWVTREERTVLHSPATQDILPDRLDAWRTELSTEDLATFEIVAGQALEDFGYTRVSETEKNS